MRARHLLSCVLDKAKLFEQYLFHTVTFQNGKICLVYGKRGQPSFIIESFTEENSH